MKHSLFLKPIWLLFIAVAALIAAHAFALYRVFSHVAWALALGLLLLLLLTHIGALGSLYAMFRRWFRHKI